MEAAEFPTGGNPSNVRKGFDCSTRNVQFAQEFERERRCHAAVGNTGDAIDLSDFAFDRAGTQTLKSGVRPIMGASVGGIIRLVRRVMLKMLAAASARGCHG
jgi:hypothetical protein